MVRESPVYPGAPVTQGTNFPVNNAQTLDVFDADPVNAQVISGLQVFLSSAISTVFTVLAHNGTTAFKVGQATLATAGPHNLLHSDYIASVNNYNPMLLLGPGWKLQITTTSVNSSNDVYVQGGPFA